MAYPERVVWCACRWCGDEDTMEPVPMSVFKVFGNDVLCRRCYEGIYEGADRGGYVE